MVNINPINVANDIAKSYLTTNPKATPQDLQIHLRNQLQELKKNGAKISDKKIAQVCAQTPDIHKATLEQIKANTVTKVTLKTKAATEALTKAEAAKAYPQAGWVADVKADRHYDEFNGLSKKARQNLHKRNMADAKAAFADERFAEPKVEVVSNNQAKKTANAEYQSVKKQKQAKKEAEIKSQAEHKAQRPIKNRKVKKARANAHYCTSQGIMTQDARKAFKNVSQGLDGKINVTINETPNTTLRKMSEFYRKEEARTAAKPVAAPEVKLPKGYPTITKPVAAPKAVTKPAAKAVETIAETASKVKGKGGKIGWIAAGVAALIGGLGLAASGKKEEAPQEALNEVA